MIIKESYFSSVAVAALILGFGLSYPVKVIMKNPELNVLAVFGIIALIFGAFTFFKSGKVASLFFTKAEVHFLLLLSLVVIGYIIAGFAHPESLSIYGNLRKFILYIGFVAITMHLCRNRMVKIDVAYLKPVMLIVSISCFAAVILNSVFRHVPQDFLVSYDKKYLVGIFFRAGAGYMDCNFLASFFIINMLISYKVLASSFGRSICIGLLFVSVVLTFSRAGLILAMICILYFSLTGFKLNIKSVANLSVGAILFFSLLILNAETIFERFVGAEGESSTDSRLNQYNSFFSHIAENVSASNVLFSYGGQDTFMLYYGEHLHNFILSSIMEIGWISTLIYMVALFIFWINFCKSGISKLAFICTLAIMSVLPTTPESIFFMFAAVAVMNKLDSQCVQSSLRLTVR